MKLLLRLLREPLLHFLAIGGLIFLLFAAVAGPSPEPTDTIVVGPARIEQLARGFQAVWRRPSTDDELRGMIDDFVREEIYYREALALGLDRNDTVVPTRRHFGVGRVYPSSRSILARLRARPGHRREEQKDQAADREEMEKRLPKEPQQ